MHPAEPSPEQKKSAARETGPATAGAPLVGSGRRPEKKSVRTAPEGAVRTTWVMEPIAS